MSQQTDTEFPACRGECGQGRTGNCQHPDRCMFDVERERPLLIGLYIAVAVVAFAASVLWPYWITP